MTWKLISSKRIGPAFPNSSIAAQYIVVLSNKISFSPNREVNRFLEDEFITAVLISRSMDRNGVELQRKIWCEGFRTSFSDLYRITWSIGPGTQWPRNRYISSSWYDRALGMRNCLILMWSLKDYQPLGLSLISWPQMYKASGASVDGPSLSLEAVYCGKAAAWDHCSIWYHAHIDENRGRRRIWGMVESKNCLVSSS